MVAVEITSRLVNLLLSVEALRLNGKGLTDCPAGKA